MNIRCRECLDWFEWSGEPACPHHCLECCDCCNVTEADWYEAEIDQRLDLKREALTRGSEGR